MSGISCMSSDVREAGAGFGVSGLDADSFEVLKQFWLKSYFSSNSEAAADIDEWDCLSSNDPNDFSRVTFDDICHEDTFFTSVDRTFANQSYDSADGLDDGSEQKKIFDGLTEVKADRWFPTTVYYFGALRDMATMRDLVIEKGKNAGSKETVAKISDEEKRDAAARALDRKEAVEKYTAAMMTSFQKHAGGPNPWDGMRELIESIAPRSLNRGPMSTASNALNAGNKPFSDVLEAAWAFNKADTMGLTTILLAREAEADLRAAIDAFFCKSPASIAAFEEERARLIGYVLAAEERFISVIDQHGANAVGKIELFAEMARMIERETTLTRVCDGSNRLAKTLRRKLNAVAKPLKTKIATIRQDDSFDLNTVKGHLSAARNLLSGHITPAGTVRANLNARQRAIAEALVQMIETMDRGLGIFGLECKPWAYPNADYTKCIITEGSCAKVDAVLEGGKCVCPPGKGWSSDDPETATCIPTKEACFEAEMGWDASAKVCIDCASVNKVFRKNKGCVDRSVKKTTKPRGGAKKKADAPPPPPQDDAPKPKKCVKPKTATAGERFGFSPKESEAYKGKQVEYRKCLKHNRSLKQQQ